MGVLDKLSDIILSPLSDCVLFIRKKFVFEKVSREVHEFLLKEYGTELVPDTMPDFVLGLGENRTEEDINKRLHFYSPWDRMFPSVSASRYAEIAQEFIRYTILRGLGHDRKIQNAYAMRLTILFLEQKRDNIASSYNTYTQNDQEENSDYKQICQRDSVGETKTDLTRLKIILGEQTGDISNEPRTKQLLRNEFDSIGKKSECIEVSMPVPTKPEREEKVPMQVPTEKKTLAIVVQKKESLVAPIKTKSEGDKILDREIKHHVPRKQRGSKPQASEKEIIEGAITGRVKRRHYKERTIDYSYCSIFAYLNKHQKKTPNEINEALRRNDYSNIMYGIAVLRDKFDLILVEEDNGKPRLCLNQKAKQKIAEAKKKLNKK